VTVTFSGRMAGTHMGRMQVDTNAWDDPATPTIDESQKYVTVHAIAVGANIQALPPIVNFGTQAIGSNTGRNLVLSNAGNANLVISGVTLMTPTPEITMMPVAGLPATLPPGMSIRVTLNYMPSNGGGDMANILVTSSDRGTPMLNVPV